MAGLMDFLQSASNSAASNVSAPVDGLAWLLRKAGVPMPQNPLLGSDWMAEKGLTKPVAQSGASLMGETAGMLAPFLAAAKAPQIAKGLLQGAENAMIPSTMSKEFGGLKVSNHSHEQMAEWANAKSLRESKQAVDRAAADVAQKAYAARKISNLPAQGMGKNYDAAQLESIAGYINSGDRLGAQAEGRSHAVSAIKSELERLGYPIEKMSQLGGGNSVYANINGKVVRVSDHALPMTPERLSNRDNGLLGKWSDEVITDQWASSNLADYIKLITKK